jgi:hypothetical protein
MMSSEKEMPKISPNPQINHGIKQPPKTPRPPKPPSQNKKN